MGTLRVSDGIELEFDGRSNFCLKSELWIIA